MKLFVQILFVQVSRNPIDCVFEYLFLYFECQAFDDFVFSSFNNHDLLLNPH